MDVSDDNWESKNTSIWLLQGKTVGEYKCTNFFAIETVSEYKYQIAMETTEWNTSKQYSTKETALWNVYKYSIFFFLFETEWM